MPPSSNSSSITSSLSPSLHRLYYPRHLSAQISADANYWLVGFTQKTQATKNESNSSSTLLSCCVVTSVVKRDEKIDLSQLHSLLNALQDHSALAQLWSSTHGAPTVIGCVGERTENVADGSDDEQKEEGEPVWIHLNKAAGSDIPAICVPPSLPSTSKSKSKSQTSAPATYQLVLYDAPESARFYALTSPFEEEMSDLEQVPHANSSSSPASPPSSLAISLSQINACRTVDRFLSYFLTHQSLLEHRATRYANHALSIPSQFDFSREIFPVKGRRVRELLDKAITTPFVIMVRMVVHTLLRVLALPSFSITQLFTSFFTPSGGERNQWKSQTLADGSITLTLVREKLQNVLRFLYLRRLQHTRSTTMTFDIASSTSMRIQEEIRTMQSNYLIDFRLGAVTTIGIAQYCGIVDLSRFNYYASSSSSTPTFLTALLTSLSSPFLNLLSSLQSTFFWFLSSDAPAGLKLNQRMHSVFGSVVVMGLKEGRSMMETMKQTVEESPLIQTALMYLLYVTLFTALFFGIRFYVSLLLDAIWIVTIPLRLLSNLLSRFYSFTLSSFSSLFLLFRGLKKNVKRKRIDSFQKESAASSSSSSANYTFEHTILSTLCLVIITCLFPTVIVWYAISRLIIGIVYWVPTLLLWTFYSIFACIPLTPFMMYMLDWYDGAKSAGKRIPAGVWFEVQQQSTTSTPIDVLQLRSSSGSFLSLFLMYRRFLTGVLARHQPQKWPSQLLWGQ